MLGIKEGSTKASNWDEDFDDISLTFWIVLWTGLAIVASLIYAKLKGKCLSESKSYQSKPVEEQIARKLVKEITRQDALVTSNRSTFRRQRSYEIIDGEVRIHYDIPFVESPAHDRQKYGENVILAAEVDSFPDHSESMDEMELVFPANLPRIVEEGEEFDDECEETVEAVALSSEVSQGNYTRAGGTTECISAIEIGMDIKAESNVIDKDTRSLPCVKEYKLSKEDDVLFAQPAEQTIATEVKNLEQEMDSCREKYPEPSLNNSDKLSSDEFSSTSEENAIETQGNVKNLRSDQRFDNQIMDKHISNSTTGSVYRLTELEGNQKHEYIVTRRIITKTQKKEEKHFKEKNEVEECVKEQVNDVCEITAEHNGLHYDYGKPRKDVEKLHSNNGVVCCLPDKEIEEEELVTEAVRANNTGLGEDLKEPEIDLDEQVVQEDLVTPDQVGSLYANELPENFPLQLNRLEDGSDLLIDNSGDFLFKVIGPTDGEFLDVLDDMEEDFPVDENDNYCEIEPEDVELSKNWKSLPSWEKVHHIQHREVDRDADDSDVECSRDDEKYYPGPGIVEMVKSEEIISSNVVPIFEECHLGSVQTFSEPEFFNRTTLVCDSDTISEKGPINGASNVTGNIPPQTTEHGGAVTIENTKSPGEIMLQSKECASNVTGRIPPQTTEYDGVAIENVKAPGVSVLQTKEQEYEVRHIPNIVSKQVNLIEKMIHNLEIKTFDQRMTKDSVIRNKYNSGTVGSELPDLQVENAPGHETCGSADTEVIILDSDENKHDKNVSYNTSNEIKDTETLPNDDIIVAHSSECIPNNEVVIAILNENNQIQNESCSELETHKQEKEIKLTNEVSSDNAAFLANKQLLDEEVILSTRKYIEEESHTQDEKIISDISDEIITNSLSCEVENTVLSDDEVIVAAYASESTKVENTVSSDDEVTVAAYASEITKESDVILASPITEVKKTPLSSQVYSITDTVQIIPHGNRQSNFVETNIDDTIGRLSPVKVTYLNDKPRKTATTQVGTDVDYVSDIDEIDIDNIEPAEKGYRKSKSVTDLDEALASVGSLLDDNALIQGFDDDNSMSKSVPDIVDSCFKENLNEAAVKTSVENLPDISLQKRNLSVSSPDFTEPPSNDQVKKITKIKIVHVKFLEMQDESGAEEDSFILEGDRPISGKMKRKSGNFSPESSPATSPTLQFNQEVDVHSNVPEKTEKKQLELGFTDLYTDLPSPTMSAEDLQEERTSTEITTRSSPKGATQSEGKHVARYAVVQPETVKYSDTHGLRLSDKFQMDSTTTTKQNPVQPPNYQPGNPPQLNRKAPPYQGVVPTKQKTTKRSKPKHSGRLVTVKGSVINDYYECSSDADSERSYNAPSPRIRTKRMSRTMAHDDHDSASSSEPDSPRIRPSDGRTSVGHLFGLGDSRGPGNEPKLFSRFGVIEDHRPVESGFRPHGLPSMIDEDRRAFDDPSGNATSRRSVMEFNPFVDIEGYDGFEPFERSHSPTSISSDQSSVFSFNCDFDPMPPPSSAFNPEVYTCENPMCRRQDILLGPEKTSYKSCPACFTYYCSSQCRKLHWPAHKQNCYFGRVNTYVRSIIRLCQRRHDLSMYLSQLARDGYQKKGRGVVMATFSSPELAREFITKGHEAFSGRKPTYSSLAELSREGIISKHRVALMQAVRDYEPNEEFVFNIAVVAVHDIPITPAPRYKLNTVLHCIKMPLNEKIVARRPIAYNKVESRLFALPKCARHEFVNEMEARRHYCRNLSKNLRQYNIKLKEDYPDCYKKLCMYVEHDISFEPMTVYGKRNNLTYKCIIAPEQNYAIDPTYC